MEKCIPLGVSTTLFGSDFSDSSESECNESDYAAEGQSGSEATFVENIAADVRSKELFLEEIDVPGCSEPTVVVKQQSLVVEQQSLVQDNTVVIEQRVQSLARNHGKLHDPFASFPVSGINFEEFSLTSTDAIQKQNTSLEADSIEWCPIDTYNEYAVVGSYHLDKSTGIKSGQIYTYKIDGRKDYTTCTLASKESDATKLRQQGHVDLSAVFDLKWSPQPLYMSLDNDNNDDNDTNFHGDLSSGGAVLGVVTADGCFQIFSFTHPNNVNNSGLHEIAKGDAAPCSEMSSTIPHVLSLDWSTRITPTISPQVATSQSDGKLALYRVGRPGEDISLEKRWSAHRYPGGAEAEVWIAAYDAHSPNVLFSGADVCFHHSFHFFFIENFVPNDFFLLKKKYFFTKYDSNLFAWDLRCDFLTPQAKAPISEHSAGVTTIQSHPYYPNVLASGSYDGCVRLWDTRAIQKGPISRWSPPNDKVCGGIWRLKWNPSPNAKNMLLAACMRGGAYTLDVGRNEQRFESNASNVQLSNISWHNQHSSMVYGADWVQHEDYIKDKEPLIVTCSFYDRALHLWRSK